MKAVFAIFLCSLVLLSCATTGNLVQQKADPTPEQREATRLRLEEWGRKKEIRFQAAQLRSKENSKAQRADRLKWISKRYTDQFTDEVATHFKQSRNESSAFICDEDGVKLQFTFGVIATPSSEVSVQVRIDDGEVKKYSGSMFRNSYEGGFVSLSKPSAKILFDEMELGNDMLLRVDTGRHVETAEISVEYFGSIRNEVGASCL